MGHNDAAPLNHQEKWLKGLKYCTIPDNLSSIYTDPRTVQAVARYLEEFVPFATIYPASICFIKKDQHRVVSLSFRLRITPVGSSTPKEMDVGFIIPQSFPVALPKCRVRLRNPTSTLTNKGTPQDIAVRLEDLPSLKTERFPCPLLAILKGLSKEFQENLDNFIKDESHSEQLQQQRSGNNAGNYAAAIPAAETLPHVRPCTRDISREREATRSEPLSVVEEQCSASVQLAARLIVSWQECFSTTYLNLREDSMPLLGKLQACHREMRRKKNLLQQQRDRINQMSAKMKKIQHSVTAFKDVENSAEVHSKCIVPADDRQAQVLDLLGEIHACDDTLDILVRSLTVQQLSCNEFIQYVSDISRKKFHALFLLRCVTHTSG
ncbi:hypothetical protein DQ04_12621000 [Trypanosoma grayi]|uniref:hypothetical protein n=1 Tax=Trypanosoma grayi TaxID=71804 RepID=UPI0004F47A56|nr:hypothetical protein DQ04_12621000 [Trypanosoma grayi]KEG06710.1 hypothetical protein DQ04_12621000 [Trypanosoma grayi]